MTVITFTKNGLNGGLLINGEKDVTACAYTKSKSLKTERGAIAFLKRRGYAEVKPQ